MAKEVGSSKKLYFWTDDFEQPEHSELSINIDPGTYLVIGVKTGELNSSSHNSPNLLSTLAELVKANNGKVVKEESEDGLSKSVRIFLPTSASLKTEQDINLSSEVSENLISEDVLEETKTSLKRNFNSSETL